MSLDQLRHLGNLTNDGNFRAKVSAILRDAEGHGYKLKIGSSLRSVEEQRKKVELGYSKTMKSKHLPGWDGLARAADIVDLHEGWDCSKDVWVMVGRLALTKGLKWGGLWGLPKNQRKKLEAFLTNTTVPFNPFNWKGQIGWDPAHVER